jgi:hypothetical protein
MKIEAHTSFNSIHPSQVGTEQLPEFGTHRNRSGYDTLQRGHQEEGTGCCSWLTDTLYCCFIAPLLSCWNCMSSCVSWFFTSNYLTLENFEEIANKLTNRENQIDEKTLLELLNWALDNPQAFKQVYQQIQRRTSHESQRFISAFQGVVLSKAGFENSQDPVLNEIKNARLEPLFQTALILSTSFSNNDFPEVLKPLIPKMKDFIAKNTKGTLVEQYKVLPLYFKHLLQKDPISFFMQFFKEWLANASYISKWLEAIRKKAKNQNVSLKDYILQGLDNDHPIAKILNNNTIRANREEVFFNSDRSTQAVSNIFREISNIFLDTECERILQEIISKIEDKQNTTFANKFKIALFLSRGT